MNRPAFYNYLVYMLYFLIQEVVVLVYYCRFYRITGLVKLMCCYWPTLSREVVSTRKPLKMCSYIFTHLQPEWSLVEEIWVEPPVILLLCMVLDMDYHFRSSMLSKYYLINLLLVVNVLLPTSGLPFATLFCKVYFKTDISILFS